MNLAITNTSVLHNTLVLFFSKLIELYFLYTKDLQYNKLSQPLRRNENC